ncbi:MAG: DUF2182 domain-containing protein [Novosphingobium sp.]
MAGSAPIERVLRRDRAITIAGLAVLCVMAWSYTLAGAGLGMSAWEMTRLVLFPHLHAPFPAGAMAGMGNLSGPTRVAAWHPLTLALMTAMWWIMMVAMMTPSAAPAILLYARVVSHAERRGEAGALAPTAAFSGGYLLAWLGFAVLAMGLQVLLGRLGILGEATMASRTALLSAAILFAAGLYQFSPLKHACLTQCRAPAAFLARYWRPGTSGALRLGLWHGAYCVGCCWLLMLLLFVGGVMNLAWIALLTALVLAEKLWRGGRGVGRASGAILCLWAVATLLV